MFIGIFPIWGFQMLTALAVSIFFRLNKVLVILAANISVFPPVILYLSHLTGAIWMGDKAEYITFSKKITLDTMPGYLFQYVIGAITLSVASGLLFGFVSYILLKILKPKPR